MQGEATFAEIFEATLDCTDMPHALGAWSRPLTTPLFIFDLPRPAVRVASVALGRDVPPLDRPRRDFVARAQAPTQTEHATPCAESPAEREIALSPRDRRSLAALNALGAGLDDRLSLSTLQRAFRRLARRYHPDRHPGSSATEQQRLARVFVEATEHYRVLVSALAVHVGST